MAAPEELPKFLMFSYIFLNSKNMIKKYLISGYSLARSISVFPFLYESQTAIGLFYVHFVDYSFESIFLRVVLF